MEAAVKLAPKLARKPRAKSKPVIVSDHLARYASAGVAFMAALSALLNGYANAQHAEVAWAGWGMGLAVPIIILMLGKVSGLLYKRHQYRAAYATAGAGVGLLALSVWHVSLSIAALTGSPIMLALPMAVAIDVGFVCCEVAALID
jgi:uncharacterized membrane protein